MASEPEIRLLQQAAVNWLSQREHSEQQLIQKLQLRHADSGQISQIVQWCKEHNYLNQQRFVAALLRNRINKGYGLRYIQQECRQQQISVAALQIALDELQPDWFEQALKTYHKKYADKPVTDYQDKIKRMAYLQRRGFSTEQIQQALTETI